MPHQTSFLTGLTTDQAIAHLAKFGKNEISRVVKANPLKILLRQFSSPLILILILAGLISLALGFLPGQEPNTLDALLILIIVLISGMLGFFQDYQAEKTIEALQQLTTPKSKVIRDGQEVEIPSVEVVPDDVLLVESGDMVTADGEVMDAFHLEVDESVLSGESKAVRKKTSEPVYSNTFVTGGHGQILVTHTAMRTKMGRVAARLQEIQPEKSTFQIELGIFSRKLSIVTLGITLLIALVGVFKFGFYISLLLAISLAVAAVPESLPAVVVLALVAGAKTMFKSHALIRKLPIVESIGAVDIICTDKTGTLTVNEMTVTRFYYNNQEYEAGHMDSMEPGDKTGQMLLKCGALCNNVVTSTIEGSLKYFGEQTEIALWKIGRRLMPEECFRPYYKINEIAFSSERKMMSAVFEQQSGGLIVFSKGAPEVLMERCRFQLINGEIVDLTTSQKHALLSKNEYFASKALRVLGFAFKYTDSGQDDLEQGLVWIGLQAMLDPPRPEVPAAIKDCKDAGIRVMMITGDNPITAQAIADRVGLNSKGVIEGKTLDQYDDLTLTRAIKDGVNIFARTTPFHKLRILEILEQEHTVAMTGDGVNDALALKRAVVGIAMGLKGTEVAKQASDFILLDDNFSTIRDAVREGRTIFRNIRKFINYLLTCNLAEVGLIFIITLLFNFSEPVLWPVQLLWINLLTDGLVALALGVDPAPDNIMRQPPRRLKEPLIDSRLTWLIILVGAKMTALLIVVFLIVLPLGLETARTTLMTGIVLFEFVRIGAIRYQEKIKWGSNPWLIWGLTGSIILQLIIVYTPLNNYFHLVPLGLYEWMVLLVGAVIGYYLAVGITRWVMLRRFQDVQTRPERPIH